MTSESTADPNIESPPKPDPVPLPPEEPPDRSKSNLRQSKRVKFKRMLFNPTAGNSLQNKPFGSFQDLLAHGLFAHSTRMAYTEPYSPVDPVYLAFLLQDWETGFSEGTVAMDTFAFKAMKGSDPDMPTSSQAMGSPQSEYWREAINIELVELERRGTWIEIHIENLPDDGNLVPGTWVFKVKHFPVGRF